MGNEKGDGAYATAAMLFPRLRRLSRVQSDSPRGLHGNPRKNLSILSLDSSERELFQESHGPFPLLSYPSWISLVFAEEKLFPLPYRRTLDFRASFASERRREEAEGKRRTIREEGRRRRREREEEKEKQQEWEAERGSAVKRGLFR